MASKKNHYAVGNLTIAGTNYKYFIENITIGVSDSTEEGAGVGSMSSGEELTKSANKITFQFKLPGDTSGTYSSATVSRANMLSLSVFTVGSVDFLGTCESGNFSVVQEHEDNSAGKDLFEWPEGQRLMIDWNLDAKINSSGTAPFVKALQTTTAHNTPRLLALNLTIQALTLTNLNVRVKEADHVVDNAKAQTVNIKGVSYGAFSVTEASSFDPLLTSILSGTGLASFTIDTGANSYTATDGSLISKATFNFANKKLTSVDVELLVRGNMT